MVNGEVIYTNSIEDFSKVITDYIILIGKECIEDRGVFHMAVPGGNTPRTVFRRLSYLYNVAKFDWSKTHVFFIDERCVLPNHADNNFGQCYNLWLRHCQGINTHRISGWINPESAAAIYEKDIRLTLNLKSGIPSFDLIFLGIGEDGHIASIFPESDFLKGIDRLVISTFVKKLNVNRITITLSLINNARFRVIGIVGDKKKKIFSELEKSKSNNYPVNMLMANNRAKDLWVIC